jgi:D-alanyl-D-alanine carboxypeptidase
LPFARALVRIAPAVALASALALTTWGMPGRADPSVSAGEIASAANRASHVGAAPSASASVASHTSFVIDEGRCNEQPPQPFLIRSSWFGHGAPGTAMFQESIRYRTEHYGRFSGFGRSEWNRHAPSFYETKTTFLGLPITLNRKVVPALHCAEKALLADGAVKAYRPRGIGGIRFHNTYRGGEVSNHVYGIAMDMDSEENTCCGCVGHWAKHPLCMKKVKSVYERTKVPPIWVDTMERFGWYWLGNDVLQDTMHFEFLGDPDKIVSGPATSSN